MQRPLPLPPPGFDELSVDEKNDYVQSLWDRIAASAETIPVPAWHHDILDERLKDVEANPDAGDSWEVVQERLRKKLDGRTIQGWIVEVGRDVRDIFDSSEWIGQQPANPLAIGPPRLQPYPRR